MLSAVSFISLVPKKRNIVSIQQAEHLVTQAENELKTISTSCSLIDEVQILTRKAGLIIDSDIPLAMKPNPQQLQDGVVNVSLTGGHSNTDHVVLLSGDRIADRIAELRRNLLTRHRAEQPESKTDDRWDKPRVPGERRRRIVREKDLPTAPPEAPISGYVIFVGQMTTKIRHDRPNEIHNQIKAVQEISKLWRVTLNDIDRKYYNYFSDEARKEYRNQHMEYRATGYYTVSTTFQKLNNAGVWVKINWNDKNDLEREIATYKTVIFPRRPPELNNEYIQREYESKQRRSLKLKRILHEKNIQKKGNDDDNATTTITNNKKRKKKKAKVSTEQA